MLGERGLDVIADHVCSSRSSHGNQRRSSAIRSPRDRPARATLRVDVTAAACARQRSSSAISAPRGSRRRSTGRAVSSRIRLFQPLVARQPAPRERDPLVATERDRPAPAPRCASTPLP
jgi:hypothetical protein